MINPLIVKLNPQPAHCAALAAHLAKLEPAEQYSDGVVEIEIVKETYDSPLVVLFREGAELGIRLGTDEGEDHAWWENRGFEMIEGETYIDPETDEEKTVADLPVRFPVDPEELGPLLLAVLRDFLQLSEGQELIAAENSNPDEWPDDIPMIVA